MRHALWLGDCLELMEYIPACSVDLVLCDMPYAVTARETWDIAIPLEPLWAHYTRVLKPRGVVALFATEPFRTQLITSNPAWFRYDLIWEKNKTTGFLNAQKQPLRRHESILIFYSQPPVYYPQKTTGHAPVNGFRHKTGDTSRVYGKTKVRQGGGSTERFPTSILTFPVVNNDDPVKVHPSQKPVVLLEYLEPVPKLNFRPNLYGVHRLPCSEFH